MNELVEVGDVDDGDFVPAYSGLDSENTSDFVKAFESNLDKKRKKRKKGVEKFIEEDEEGIALPVTELEDDEDVSSRTG